MFQSKFVKTTNLRISYNVTVINNFLYSFCLSKWYLSIFFGKASIICNQYILWVSLRWNSIFKSFQGFIFPLSLNNWPINFNFFFFRKKEKCTGVLSTLISEWSQKTSGKIRDGRVDFEVKLSINFMKIWKNGNFERMSLLTSTFLWNLKYLPKCVSIKNSGITFQSWESSSNNLFTQEHYTFYLISYVNIFIPLFS